LSPLGTRTASASTPRWSPARGRPPARDAVEAGAPLVACVGILAPTLPDGEPQRMPALAAGPSCCSPRAA
jgi:hypothetical protein